MFPKSQGLSQNYQILKSLIYLIVTQNGSILGIVLNNNDTLYLYSTFQRIMHTSFKLFNNLDMKNKYCFSFTYDITDNKMYDTGTV